MAEAGFFSAISNAFLKSEASESSVSNKGLQNMAILESSGSPTGISNPRDIVIEKNALISETTPTGDVLGEVKPEADQISVYEVREGDTLSSIAQMFNVSANTIRWANDISGPIKKGQVLTILPVSGIRYTAKKGDTVASIAKAYKSDPEEIKQFNDIKGSLSSGQIVIIPDGEAPGSFHATLAKKPSSSAGYFSRPVKGGTRTQGIHGHNGVDIAARIGTPIYAAAAGEVIISRVGGYNGGYGNYIVVKHGNGMQTLYAHLDEVQISAGTSVSKGDQIGTMGNTGKSTGVHLHFEVRGGTNPF